MKTYNLAFALPSVFAVEDFTDQITLLEQDTLDIDWYECQNGLVLLTIFGYTENTYEVDLLIDTLG